jgi:hypothetical protein
MELEIKEDSWIAKIAAAKLHSENVAIVLGKTIHLYHVSKEDFLKNEKWVKHEICHLRQYKKYGFFFFICRYLWECVRVGYYKNKFEVEARKAENV